MAERRVAVRFSAEVAGYVRAMGEAAGATKKTKAAVDEAGKASETAGKQSTTATESAGLSVRKLSSDARENAASWDAVGNSMMTMGALGVAALGLAITKYASFDKAMSNVQAATHESTANMELLREAAIKTGADTAFSAEEAAQGIEELAKAGVETADILNGGLAGALDLAAAGAMAVGDAAELSATAMTQFKLQGKDIPHIADLLAAGAGKAQGSVHDLGMALNQAGLVASGTGLSIEETTGTLAAFASAGLVGSDAGTAFKSMLQRLQNPSKESAREMAALGLNMYDANGNMTDMTVVADQLQAGLADLTDAERDKALATIFGSDAVRAANVLYTQGAKGIQEWTDKVNDAGYAATTASIMQDNLAGDIEKLGGAFDTVFIKGGGSASEALRGLIQSGESLVDMVGKIPTPILETGFALLGTVGTVGLAGGAFLKFTPMIVENIDAFRNLGTEGSKVPGIMGKAAKGLGIATVAFGALSIAGTLAARDVNSSTSDVANSVLKLTKSGEGVDALNAQFRDWDTLFGSNTVHGVESVSDAIQRLVNPQGMDGFNDAMNRALVDNGPGGWMNLAPSATKQIEDRLNAVGDALGNLASGGAQKAAADGFKKLSDEFERNGATAQDALDTLPGYSEALLDLGNSVGVDLEDWELLDLAMGKIPPRLAEAGVSIEGASKVVGTFKDATGAVVPVTEEMSEALAEVGLAADGTVASLDKYLESLFAAGLAVMDTREASFEWQNTLRDMGGEIEALMGKQGELGAVLNETGTDFNKSTDAGLAANEMLQGFAREGLNVAQIMSNDVNVSQEQVQEQLRSTYDAIMTTAQGFGIGATEAEALTREVLQIPEGVSIETWMDEEAKRRAEALTGNLNSLDGRVVNTYVNINETTTRKEIRITERNEHVGVGQVGLHALGGRLPKNSSGSRLPITGPGTDRTDGILGISSDGVPMSWVDAGEWIINARSSEKYNRELAAINAGTFPQLPGYASGVRVGREYSAPAAGVAGGPQQVIEKHYHTHVSAGPGLEQSYAQNIANQSVQRQRDLQNAYGN